MSFLFSLKSEQYLEIRATKNINFTSTQKMLDHVLDISTNKNIYLLYFNFADFEVTISPFETYELFQQAMAHENTGPYKIAFVHKLLENRMDHYHAENVGQNNGFTISGFLYEDDAKEWLLTEIDEIFETSAKDISMI